MMLRSVIARLHLFAALALPMFSISATAAAKAPQWLHDLVQQPIPAHAPDLAAVQLLSDTVLTVSSDGRMRKQVRVAYRILRPEGESRAVQTVVADAWQEVKELRGWTIPPSGADFEAHFGDSILSAVVGVDGGELVTDTRSRVLRIPGAHVGALVGFEYEVAVSPLQSADTWDFQDTIPVLHASYELHVPRDWVVRPAWIHFNERPAETPAPGVLRWTLTDLPRIAIEPGMAAWRSVAGQLYVSFSPPGKAAQLGSWSGIGAWFGDLQRQRLEPTAEMRKKVTELVAAQDDELAIIRTLASYVQREVRYVAIELGIGGYQPHAAGDVLSSRFGDCKDKATLLQAMLSLAGIDAFPVVVNTDRAAIDASSQPSLEFDHVVLAIRLPAGVKSPDLLSRLDTTDLGELLIFDPTDETTPVGRLSGILQGGYGLLVTPQGGQLMQLPRISASESGVHRTASLTLGMDGMLKGTVLERSTGDAAARQRSALRTATRDVDMIGPVQSRLAESLTAFAISAATVRNRKAYELPLEWNYQIEARNYARTAGDHLLVRPRVFGIKVDSRALDGEQREHDLQLGDAHRDADEFTIELPAGFEVVSLPPPVDIDIGIEAYHSRTEVDGNRLRFTRTFEQRELVVPLLRFQDYRDLNRAISRDERAVAELRPR